MKLTNEQKNIVFSDAALIYVSARAGTGKTTTLKEFVKYRKFDTFLYIVYNSSIKEEAIGKFPNTTTIHTIHSLAYSVVGHKYSHKTRPNIRPLDVYNDLDIYKEKDFEDPEIYDEVSKISKMLNDFFNSAAKSLDEMYFGHYLLPILKNYWNDMKNPESEIKISFDGFLKIYHLTNPVLDYDYIMVDEAQDSNEVMLDIVMKQSAKKVFVGDQHQRIYSFRGAIDIFTDTRYFNPDCEYLSLTESFRFGDAIAEKANLLLHHYKKEPNLITGTDLDSKIEEIDKDLQYTIITRTNAHLFDLAYNLAISGKKIHIVGATKFNDIKDAYYLYKNEHSKIENDFLRKFNNFKHLEGVAKSTGAPDMLVLVKIVKKYKDNLFKAIQIILENSTYLKKSDVILSTAHKSKGLEFVSVKLADDFLDLFDENGFLIPAERIDLEEINLLYVGITRAMFSLELNENLKKLTEVINFEN